MDNLEQTIQAVLNDPEQMKSIMEMAKSLGFSPPDADSSAEESSSQMPQGLGNLFSEPVSQLLLQSGGLDQKQENLLKAIKPFLSPAKQEKIDRAMQVARLSNLAGYALRSREQKDE